MVSRFRNFKRERFFLRCFCQLQVMKNISDTEAFLKKKLDSLSKILEEYQELLSGDEDFSSALEKYKINPRVLDDIRARTASLQQCLSEVYEAKGEDFFRTIRALLLDEYGAFVDLLKMLFYQLVYYHKEKNIVEVMSSDEEQALPFMGGNYILLTTNFKSVRNTVNQFFFKDIKLKDELIVDETTELWHVTDMEHKLYPSDFFMIREYTNEVTEIAREELDRVTGVLLSQQVSEIIKNAVKHGNKSDPNKIIKVWYRFNGESYRIIVEDEGEGFQDLEEWNDFNRRRNEAVLNQDIESLAQLIAFHRKDSDENDGGNALFSSLEYWDSGLIYNAKKNKVLALKYFFADQKGGDV